MNDQTLDNREKHPPLDGMTENPENAPLHSESLTAQASPVAQPREIQGKQDEPIAEEFAPLRPTPGNVHSGSECVFYTNTAAPTCPPYQTEPQATACAPHPAAPRAAAYTPRPATPPAAAYTPHPATPPASAYTPRPATPPASAYTPRPAGTPTYASRPPAPPVRADKKEKKSKSMGWRIALIALCCALLGSALGGGIVGYYLKDQTPEQSVPTAQIPTTQTPTYQQTVNPIGTTATSLAQIYSNCVPSIVGVSNQYTTYNYFGQPTTAGSTGTGFIISEDGEILTNYHVVENAETLTVTMYDGTEYSAELLGYEAESDVALLKIDAQGLQAVTMGNSDVLAVGDQVAAIGNPLGELTYTMTVGYVSAKGRAVYTDEMPINMLQIDAAINSGNSGGPLFNLAGEVVGITTAKYSGSINGSAEIEGIGFAIPINDALSIVDDLRKYGSVQNRAYIGVTVTNSQAGGDIPAGALIQSVEKNSSGEKAGLRVSDIITAVGETSVTGIDTLYSALRPYRAGDTVQITVFRSGETKILTITFDASPDSETNTEITPEEFEFPWG